MMDTGEKIGCFAIVTISIGILLLGIGILLIGMSSFKEEEPPPKKYNVTIPYKYEEDCSCSKVNNGF